MINCKQLQTALNGKKPQVALILGSGLGEVAEALSDQLVIDYRVIEGFPQSTVAGHRGRMIVGKIGKKEVLCLQGRFHLYEGYAPQVIAEVIGCLKYIGIRELIVTNAAGSLNPDFAPGSLMLINDHINFSGRNPLVGTNNDAVGPRFPDMGNAYDRRLRKKMEKVAADLKIELPQGVYLMVLGPNFETAAEIRAFRVLGADAVGMSTVPEVIAAVHAGIKVVAISAITNYGTGMQQTPLSHGETMDNAGKAAADLTKLIINYIKED